MGDPQAPPLNAEAILRALDTHEVAYVVVGGFAAVAYGAERLTYDIDIVPGTDRNNLENLAGALQDLSAQLRVEGGGVVEFPIDATSLGATELSTWRTSAGDLDIIRGLPRTSMSDLANFEDLIGDGSTVTVYGLTIHLASLEDIIQSKIVTNREPDRQALPELLRLQRHLNR